MTVTVNFFKMLLKFLVVTSFHFTGNQCILRYAARLNEDQINEILLGLENGLTEKQVKTYFILPADKMKQYRRAYEFANE